MKSMKLSETIIEPLLPSEISNAADLLSRSLSTDPMSIGLFREPSKKTSKTLAHVFKLMLEALPCEILCIKDAGRVVAVMRMVKPGKCQPSTKQLLQAMPRLLGASGTKFNRVLKYLTFLSEYDPKERHWHLGPFAVDPEVQGMGFGSHLLNYVCDYVDRRGDAAYLETNKARNVKFYERYDFSTINEALLYDVPNWFMWRATRKFSVKT